MQRVRMSLPYFKKFGWDAEVVKVMAKFSAIPKDSLLLQTIPQDITIHRIKALDKSWTSKLGFGNIALRSYWFYKKQVNRILKKNHYDLIYFSTTQFPVCILGAYWKKRFKIPYVIDMQDPWFSDYYEDKPKEQRPAKYWFSYRLNKYLEPKAMRHVDGLISVSEKYVTDLKERYPVIKDIPAETITFGAFDPDLIIAEKNKSLFDPILNPATRNIVYIGRGGADMHASVSALFKAFKAGLEKTPELFSKIKLYFIGTSYAPTGYGAPTILPLAKQFGIEDNVIEITDRISYYHTLLTLQQADALFIPGSDDPKYTASKIYPYILTGKPLLAIFNPESSAIETLKEYRVKHVYDYAENSDIEIYTFLKQVAEGKVLTDNYNTKTIKKYSAENMTRRQCELFDKLILNR
ncbi:MAG TPA: glycosyltransferase [Mucilaginibacter sp.]|nr:glycosyltransferase [Mucilaginibacter sp.]